jgi:23S rRNA (uracil1939-C5)-methyltransferase
LSDDQVTCRHAAVCAGCTEIGTPYAAQLAKKTTRLVKALSFYPNAVSTVDGATKRDDVHAASRLVGYRTRAKWMVGPDGEVGLFAREGAPTEATTEPRSSTPERGRQTSKRATRGHVGGGSDSKHRVVDIPDCRVLPSALLQTAAAVRALLATTPLPGLRAIDARHVVAPVGASRAGVAATEQVLVTLLVDRRLADRPAAQAFAQALVAHAPVIAGVALGTRDADAIQVLGDAPVPLLGVTFADDDVGGPSPAAAVRATFGAFVQANRDQARVLIARVIAALPPRGSEPPRVLDVYGGSGAFSLALASLGADVELIEAFAPAAALAEETARSRGLHLRAHAGDARALLEDASTEAFDLVVVNPPRRGVAREAREALGRTELGKLVYISCEPTTLARDLAHLARLGLTAERLSPVDMMPQTAEIETVAVLSRAPAPPPRRLYEDEQLLVIDKDPYEPTTPQGEHTHSLLARVRGLPGWSEAQPIHRLDRDTSGVCLFARRADEVHGFALALGHESARKTYLALARGITHGKGTITSPLVEQGRPIPAVTRYRRRSVVRGHSLLEVSPQQGKKHQIRRHLASIDHPIVGDERYGDQGTARYFQERWGLDRPFLHCHRLQIVHPRTHEILALEAPLPADLEALIETLSQSRPKAAHRRP